MDLHTQAIWFIRSDVQVARIGPVIWIVAFSGRIAGSPCCPRSSCATGFQVTSHCTNVAYGRPRTSRSRRCCPRSPDRASALPQCALRGARDKVVWAVAPDAADVATGRARTMNRTQRKQPKALALSVLVLTLVAPCGALGQDLGQVSVRQWPGRTQGLPSSRDVAR